MTAHISNPSALAGGRRFDINAMRPFIGNDGRSYTVNETGDGLIPAANAALLRYDEQKDIDTTVVEAARDRLVAIRGIQQRGLTRNISMFRSISQWETQSLMTGASYSMSGMSQGDNDTVEFERHQIPVPIVHQDFWIDWRRLNESRALGESLDTSQAAIATQNVVEASEDMLFSTTPIQVEGNSIYGYLNHPDRNTVTMSIDWASVTNNSNILDEINTALQKLRDARFFGPYVMYIPGQYEFKLDEDFDADTSDTRTLRDRLLALSGMNEIQISDRLNSGDVVIVQLTRNVVDLAVAQTPTTVNWQTMGGMAEHYKVMAVWAPRVKSDHYQRSGIAQIGTGV